MKKWKAVFFDLDDTLYSRAVPFAEACDDFFCSGQAGGRREKRIPFDPAAAHERFRARGDEVFLPSRRGEITMDEMYIYRFKRAMADFGIAVSDEESLLFQKLYKSRQNRIHLDPAVSCLLSFVKETGVKMGVITNGPQDHQRDKFFTLGLDRFMDPESLFVSGAYGSNKPETLMFEEAEKQLGMKPDDFLYLGDSFESDVCGSMAAGWDVIWMDLKQEAGDDLSEKLPRSDAQLWTVSGLAGADALLRKLLKD